MDEDKNKKISELDDLDLDPTASLFADDAAGDDAAGKDNDNSKISDEDLASYDQDDDIEPEDDSQSDAQTDKDFISIPKSKIFVLNQLLKNIKGNCEQAANLISGIAPNEDISRISIGQLGEDGLREERDAEIGREKVIEGVFDGEKMIGPDGKQYTVPANYASKSKLVEGDMLKLTITPNGTFLYKQIGPIERSRIIGAIEKDEEGNFFIKNQHRKWRVITASVTYFRGEVGDEAVILVPKGGESRWAAVENVIKAK
jgi:hypothetical protein